MIDIHCYLGVLRDRLASQIPHPLTLDGATLADIYRRGSLREEGRGDIRLRLHPQARLTHSVLPSSVKGNPYHLNRALAQLLPRQVQQGPVNEVGLLFAERLALPGHERALGMMFDADFSPHLRLPESFLRVPRQGCAVFVDAIRDIRPDDDDFRTELAFTAIHELGHLFNLWHLTRRDNFMAHSPRGKPFGRAAHGFLPEHTALLSRCSESLAVQPGGRPFGDRGGLGPPSPGRPETEVLNAAEIAFTIGIAQAEFWPWEPVELDIALRVRRGRAVLPDMIDCSYDGFAIWIEDPDGALRAYRPPRWYGSNSGRIGLAPGRDYERDISIFGQSGGYTFHHTGAHRIWALCRTSAARVLRSNTLVINVKPPPSRGGADDRLARLFQRPDVATLCYHREGRLSRPSQQHMASLQNVHEQTHAMANLHYALARASATRASRSAGAARRRDREAARDAFRQALAFEHLSPHRRRIAEALSRP